MHHSLVPFLNFKKELYSKDKMIDKKNSYYIRILIPKRDLELFWLFLKSIKLENETKSLVSGCIWP